MFIRVPDLHISLVVCMCVQLKRLIRRLSKAAVYREEEGGGRPSQLISPQSAAPAAVARLQGGLQAGQCCYVGVILSREGEWIWREHREKNPVAMSGSSDLKGLSLMQGTSCQVGVSFKPVKGRHVEAVVVRMFNRFKG